MAVLNIAPYLPVDGIDVVDSASVSVPMNLIEDAYLSHVTNITEDGYAPDQHTTAHILSTVPTAMGVALTNTTVALDVRLNQIMTLIKSMAGTGTAYSDITVPTTLAAVNTTLLAATSSPTANTLAKRNTDGASNFAALGVGAAIGSPPDAKIKVFNLTGADGFFPVNRTIASDSAGVAGFAGDNMNTYYSPTTIGTLGGSLGVGFTGQQHNIYIGQTYAATAASFPTAPASGTWVGAQGSVLGYQSVMYIKKLADSICEQAMYVGTLRYDQLSSETNGGRAWITDTNVMAPIGVRMSGMSGYHATVRNFYAGVTVASVPNQRMSPLGTGTGMENFDPTGNFNTMITNNGSVAYAAINAYGGIGMNDTSNIHSTTETYPTDMGFLVSGSSGSTGQRQGWRVAYMAGGLGSNWGGNVPHLGGGVYSRIGKGFFSRDHEEQAFYAFDKFTSSTALAFVSSAGAGNNLFGSLVGNPSSTNAGSTVTIGANFPTSTLQALTSQSLTPGGPGVNFAAGTLSVFAGALASNTPTNIRALSVGMSGAGGTNDTVILNHRFYRNLAGSDYTTTSLGLTFDANATTYSGLWLTKDGVGVGATNYLPTAILDVAGTLVASGNVAFGAAITTNTGFKSTPTPSGAASIWGAYMGAALTPNASAGSLFGMQIAPTFDGTPGASVNVYSLSLSAPSKSAGTAATTATTLNVLAPITATAAVTAKIATFNGTANGANAQVVTFDATGHIAFSSGAAPVASGLLANVTSVTFTGNDQRGIVVIVTSGAIGTASTVATCTFAAAMNAAPAGVSLVPNDSVTWALAGTAQLTPATLAAGTFLIKSGSTSTGAGTWTYTYTAI